MAASSSSREDQAFIEVEVTPGRFQGVDEVAFHWRGAGWAFARPERLGDLHFVRVAGVSDAPPVLEVVLVRRAPWWERMRSVVRRRALEVLESDARAYAIERSPDDSTQGRAGDGP